MKIVKSKQKIKTNLSKFKDSLNLQSKMKTIVGSKYRDNLISSKDEYKRIRPDAEYIQYLKEHPNTTMTIEDMKWADINVTEDENCRP